MSCVFRSQCSTSFHYQLTVSAYISLFNKKPDHQSGLGNTTVPAMNEDRHTSRVAVFIGLPAARHRGASPVDRDNSQADATINNA